jgi:hypothetical protein
MNFLLRVLDCVGPQHPDTLTRRDAQGRKPCVSPKAGQLWKAYWPTAVCSISPQDEIYWRGFVTAWTAEDGILPN